MPDRGGGRGRRRAWWRRSATTRARRCACSPCWARDSALADHLVNHPAHWHELTDPGLGSTRPAAWAVREALRAAVAGKPDAEAVDALRVEYRRLLLRLAARDLTHHLGVDDAAAGACRTWRPARWRPPSTWPGPGSARTPTAPGSP
ncbi:hypothetical protein [Nocardioides convexus]|uniref:hypothetical protein n=1 Tax=Nocardioides convexus TaxID=2712224 RepID=UPI0024181A36|nr:hypothetical protein [Nocardioides convexus]